MRYGSLCSGIEAASVAWHPLGWQPQFFSEIDKSAARVLAHHYPHVPNHGDMTKFQEWPDHAIDLLVGGTPCQSFSVAGLRKGMADPRGNLALVYLAIAARYHPKWLVWENVPGVLSSNGGRDFGAFLGALAELGYGWAYRVVDAQFVRVDGFGRAVPQRRRRVFVVGCAGDWRRAAAVLFERESLHGHSPPRRQAGQGFARGIEIGPSCGGFTDVNPTLDCCAKDGPIRNQLAGAVMCGDISPALKTRDAKGPSSDGDGDGDGAPLIAHSLRASGFDASEDGTGRGVPIIPVAGTMKAMKESGGWSNSVDHAAAGYMVPVAYRTTGNDGCYETGDITHALNTATDPNQHVLAIQERAVCENPFAGPDGAGVRSDGAAYTLEARQQVQAVAFDLNQITSKTNRSQPSPHIHHTLPASAQPPLLATQWAVRRLTPTECERLQGFPDGYTSLADSAKLQADGPRYKQLGNSMAVNVMRWLGRRIDMVNTALAAESEAA